MARPRQRGPQARTFLVLVQVGVSLPIAVLLWILCAALAGPCPCLRRPIETAAVAHQALLVRVYGPWVPSTDARNRESVALIVAQVHELGCDKALQDVGEIEVEDLLRALRYVATAVRLDRPAAGTRTAVAERMRS